MTPKPAQLGRRLRPDDGAKSVSSPLPRVCRKIVLYNRSVTFRTLPRPPKKYLSAGPTARTRGAEATAQNDPHPNSRCSTAHAWDDRYQRRPEAQPQLPSARQPSGRRSRRVWPALNFGRLARAKKLGGAASNLVELFLFGDSTPRPGAATAAASSRASSK